MKHFEKPVANPLVQKTVNANSKVQVDLKLQLRRRTSTLIFTKKYLTYLMNFFLCTELKKKLSVWNAFKIQYYFFSIGISTTSKLDDGKPVTHL